MTRNAFDEALTIAANFSINLRGVVDRLAIGGSLRRGVDVVKDIEIVVRPKYFDAGNMLEVKMEHLWENGFVTKRLNRNGHEIAWGKPGEDSRFKAFTYRGVAIDLFIVLPDRDWGPTMVLRTGPGEANQALVTTEGKRTRNGVWGLLPAGMRFEDGALWNGSEKLDTPEEVDVFNAIGLPWIPPHLRDHQAYRNWLGLPPDYWEPTCGYIWRFGRPVEIPMITELGKAGDFSRPVTQQSLF